MHMHIRSKHVWGFFPSVTKNIICQKFAVPQLILCATKCNNILKWGIGHFLYNPWFHGRFHCSNIAVSPRKSGKKLIPAKNYLVCVRKYSPMFTDHFQVRRSKRRAAEDLRRHDSPAVAVTGDRPKRSRKLTPRGQAFVERVREVSQQHGDESAGPSHSRQDMATQPSAGGHVNQQPAQPSAGGFSPNHQPAQLFAGGPHQNLQMPTQLSAGGPNLVHQQPAQLSAGGPQSHQRPAQLSAGSRLLEQPAYLLASGSSHPPHSSLQQAPSNSACSQHQLAQQFAGEPPQPATLTSHDQRWDAMMQQLQSMQALLQAQQHQISQLQNNAAPPQPPAQPPVPTDTQLAPSQCAPSVQINEQPQPLPTGSGEIESPLVVGRVGVQLAPDPRPMITAGMPLGHSLPEKLKQDIWDDKFIDMAALLYPVTHTTYGVQLSGDLENGQGLGEIQLTHQRKKISSISDWSKAFSTFISVYIQKPGREGDATQLLTYMAEIQSIAEDGLDWFMYDDLYRRDRASTKNPPSWATVNQTLHNKIMRKHTTAVASPCPPLPNSKNHFHNRQNFR